MCPFVCADTILVDEWTVNPSLLDVMHVFSSGVTNKFKHEMIQSRAGIGRLYSGADQASVIPNMVKGTHQT